MAEKTTFIKLDRNIQRWRWWGNDLTFKVFCYLLMNANVEDRDFENITVHRGQLVTSFAHIASDCLTTINKVRKVIERLESTHEITKCSTPKYTVITVLNYDLYQKSTKKSTNESQTNPKRITNKSQQYKNNKNISKDIKNKKNTASPVRKVYADGLPPMTEEELQAHIRSLREQD